MSKKHPFFRGSIPPFGGIRPFVPVCTTFYAFGNSAYIHAKDMVYPLIKSECPPVCHRIVYFLYFDNPRANWAESGPRVLMFINAIFTSNL